MAFMAIGLPIGLAIGIAIGTGMDNKAAEEGLQLKLSRPTGLRLQADSVSSRFE